MCSGWKTFKISKTKSTGIAQIFMFIQHKCRESFLCWAHFKKYACVSSWWGLRHRSATTFSCLLCAYLRRNFTTVGFSSKGSEEQLPSSAPAHMSQKAWCTFLRSRNCSFFLLQVKHKYDGRPWISFYYIYLNSSLFPAKVYIFFSGPDIQVGLRLATEAFLCFCTHEYFSFNKVHFTSPYLYY